MLKYCIFSKKHVSFEVLISSFSNFFDFEIVRFFQESLITGTLDICMKKFDAEKLIFNKMAAL